MRFSSNMAILIIVLLGMLTTSSRLPNVAGSTSRGPAPPEPKRHGHDSPPAPAMIDYPRSITYRPSDTVDAPLFTQTISAAVEPERGWLFPLLLAVNVALVLFAGAMFAVSHAQRSLPLVVLGLVGAIAIPRLPQRNVFSLSSAAAARSRPVSGRGHPRWVVERQRDDSLHWLERVPLDRIAEGEFSVVSTCGLLGRYHQYLKRVLGICFAVVLGTLALPLLSVVGLAIVIDSPGPIFYSQIRVGLNGCRFRIYKLQSMSQDAERNGAVFAETPDPRVTRVGRLLRLSRIDELPQLWNCLRGEMSVVGPRPKQPVFAALLEQTGRHYAKRYATKPGLTGWAQVRHRPSPTSTVRGTLASLSTISSI